MILPVNINITTDLDGALKRFIQNEYTKIGVLVDENTRKYCYPLVEDIIPTHVLIEIESGEEQKNLRTCEFIWQQMTDYQFDRKSLLINVGGGVIGDMGGFCASTYKRGIDFINLPTTLLSQVDASVGGKLGVDFNGLKNHIGIFKEPLAVIINDVFLNTLPNNEVRSGFAEVIKHSLIADVKAWPNIKSINLSDVVWGDFIEESVSIKYKVVKEDLLEGGVRKILNFGHTIGHAIETYHLNKNRLLHGEAIAIGMICEAWISTKKTGLNKQSLDEIVEVLLGFYGKVDLNDGMYGEVMNLVLQDKKNEKNVIQCTLLEEIGSSVFNIPIDKEDIFSALKYYEGL